MLTHARKEGLCYLYVARQHGFHPVSQYEVFGNVFHNPFF